jgi:hypothetical protein
MATFVHQPPVATFLHRLLANFLHLYSDHSLTIHVSQLHPWAPSSPHHSPDLKSEYYIGAFV